MHLFLAVLLSAAAQEERKLAEIPMFAKDLEDTISWDGRHWGYVVREGEGAYAVIDGKKGERFEHVEGLAFLEDGRACYTAFAKNRQTIVVDGKAGPWFDEMEYVLQSDGGTRIATVVTVGERRHFLADLELGPAYDEISWWGFSPDGKRTAYVGKRGGKHYVVVDGKASPAYDSAGLLTFTPDGGYVHPARTGKREFVVRDGTAGKEYDRVTSLKVSNEGRIAYAAQSGSDWFLVIDGTVLPRPGAVSINFIQFGPGRLAFAEKRLGEDFVIVATLRGSGEKVEMTDVGTQPCGFLTYGFTFSPDGKELSWFTTYRDRTTIVLGDRRFDVKPSSVREIRYSRDGKRVGASGMEHETNAAFLILDGKICVEKAEDVDGPVFGPTGTAWYVVQEKGRHRVHIDGQAQEESEEHVYVTFASNGAYAYTVRSGKHTRLVVQGRRVEGLDAVRSYRFSDDGATIGIGVRIGRELWWKVRPVK
jgi:hypothetical protein